MSPTLAQPQTKPRRLGLWSTLVLAALATGCAAINNNVLNLTPEQYFNNARKKYLALRENANDKSKISDILRLAMTGEKISKKNRDTDSLRLQWLIAKCEFIRMDIREKRFRESTTAKNLKNRSIYVFDDRATREEAVELKRWMKTTEKEFKTKDFADDLKFVKGYYLNTLLFLAKPAEIEPLFAEAYDLWTELTATDKKFSTYFTILGRPFSSAEARFWLIELFTLAEYPAEALQLLRTWETRGLEKTSIWRHRFLEGQLYARMGLLNAAIKTLKPFKGLLPDDCVFLDQALWWLKGCHLRRGEIGDMMDQAKTEAIIIEKILGDVPGFFSQKSLLTPDKFLPWPTPHEPLIYGLVTDWFDHLESAPVAKFETLVAPPYARDYGRYYSILERYRRGDSLDELRAPLLDLVKTADREIQRENALNRYLEIVEGLPKFAISNQYEMLSVPGIHLGRLVYSRERVQGQDNSKSAEKDKKGKNKRGVLKAGVFAPTGVIDEESRIPFTLSLLSLENPRNEIKKGITGEFDVKSSMVGFLTEEIEKVTPGFYIARVTWPRSEGESGSRNYILKIGDPTAETPTIPDSKIASGTVSFRPLPPRERVARK